MNDTPKPPRAFEYRAEPPLKFKRGAMDPIANLHRLYPELAAGAEIPNGPLGLLKLRFAEGFAPWGIGLPEDNVAFRRRGSISEKGWSIRYLFGRDERGTFLDFYAHHRMTSDTHLRLHEDGTATALPSMLDLCPCSSDPVRDAQLKAEFVEHNRRVEEELRSKGF